MMGGSSGCAAKCPEPRVEYWSFEPEYTGRCEADGWPAKWECYLYAVDGGVELAGGSCVIRSVETGCPSGR